jgi:diacylglycerol O-acyltransferase / wax synthase
VERLRGLDSAFLYLETPSNHMHVAWAAVLDTSEVGDAADPGRLADLVNARLHLLPALRRRLASSRLGYTQPDWIDVAVDPADHIVRHDDGDLEKVAARVLSTPLDRTLPLWEMHVVPGLAQARTGLIIKLHHALLDGPSGAELMVQLLDLEPTPAVAALPVTPASPEVEPSPADLRAVARKRAAHGAARTIAGVRHAGDIGAATTRWDLQHQATIGRLPLTVPRARFNQPVTARRLVRWVDVPLDAIDHWRRDTGSTVNDAVLALTGGALRRYLLGTHALPLVPLVAMVPISQRDSGSATGGNQLSALFTTLGTDIADPATRLAEITRVTRLAKRRHDETGVASLSGLSDLVPPRAGQGLAWLARRTRLSAWSPLMFNVVVSNVPGPDTPFYCNGAIVEAAIPMGPVTDWSALNVTVVSYRRTLTFGVVACPDVIRDLDRLMDDLHDELDTLRLASARS